ncbi:MAG TPA: tetratricopeptide repeat protein [Candidatus Cybelea sp.]|nr:tetratricopeptide repeat protein [Candidatus Cybelea sp.]
MQRKLTTILAADVAGYSRLTGGDEEGTLARLRAIRKELVDPAIAANRGRIVKTTGDGMLAEFASVVDAVRSALEVQRAMVDRNAGLTPHQRIDFRVGINLGDVVVEDDGDLMGEGVNVAARLEGIAAPGGICLSRAAYDQVRGKIDVAMQDLGEQRLKNIAEPVRVYAITPVHGGAPQASPTLAPRLSIVVLPFANLGGDAEQDYFVDGITESLTTDLSRIPGAFVIARNTAFTFKGKAVDARKVGRELGVRYVMEGSVQTGGNRIRVNAQLIDVETGAHLWAERFDKPRADLFDMQDEITARLARTVGIELVAAEGRRAERERPDNMDAVDLAMRGRAVMNRPPSLDNVRQARDLFEAALRLDDRNVEALVGLGESHAFELRSFASTARAEQLSAAEAAIDKALTLAPENANAHNIRAGVLFLQRRPERALEEAELAISLDRNLPSAQATAAFLKMMVGRAEETEDGISEAIRLSPRDPALSQWYSFMGVSNVYRGRLDRAVEHLRRAVTMNPRSALPHFFLAAALALTGRIDEAARARDAGLKLDPNFSLSRFRNDVRSDNPVYLEQRQHIYEGMRKAGVPEER